jgi:hypothetical protein
MSPPAGNKPKDENNQGNQRENAGYLNRDISRLALRKKYDILNPG